MNKVAGRTIAECGRGPIEARFFTQGGQVDEGTFWREVERLAGAGARAQITAEEVRWRLTPKGEAALAAAEREAEAAHQALRDRDREPDRWPTHRAQEAGR